MTMPIVAPEVKKTVYDYDIVFASGIAVSYTIDPSNGDSIKLEPSLITIHLASKKDPGNTRPAEDTTLFMAHIASLHSRTREEVALSPEQKHQWEKTWEELTHPTVQ